KEMQIIFSPSGGDSGIPNVESGTGALQWQFADEDDNWNVVLTDSYLTLEARAYRDFQDFLRRFRRLVEALRDHIKPKVVTRIGLRYIDEIRTDMPWPQVIRHELLGPLGTVELGAKTELSVQRLVLRYSASQAINISHGLFPKGSTVAP